MEPSENLYRDEEEFNRTMVGEIPIDMRDNRDNNSDPSTICYCPYRAYHYYGYYIQNGKFIQIDDAIGPELIYIFGENETWSKVDKPPEEVIRTSKNNMGKQVQYTT